MSVHEPHLYGSRFGCWCLCRCGWRSGDFTTISGAHHSFGADHLLSMDWRQCVTRSGVPKARYSSWSRAESICLNVWLDDARTLYAYRCDWCRYWHVGKRKDSRQ